MAFKRSAVRFRLSPPKGVHYSARKALETLRFRGFFFLCTKLLECRVTQVDQNVDQNNTISI